MAFSDFTFDDLEARFGVKNRVGQLFSGNDRIEPGAKLTEALSLAQELPVRSEKAKSELLVLPILLELRSRNNKFFTIYSGDILNADKEKGLIGECDFLLAKDTGSFSINYPIIQLVEAKRNDIEEGLRQCAAQLVGARLFNEKKGITIPKLYGCATTGDDWQFLVLEDDLTIDNQKYYLNDIGRLLAVLQTIIDYYKQQLP